VQVWLLRCAGRILPAGTLRSTTSCHRLSTVAVMQPACASTTRLILFNDVALAFNGFNNSHYISKLLKIMEGFGDCHYDRIAILSFELWNLD
jgi:hypothetical protein